MGGSKKYSGYKSYEYLEPRIDYASYPLEKQVNRFPAYDFGLSKTQEEHVREIIEKNIIIDLHEHLSVFPEEDYKGPTLRSGREFTAYEGLASVGFDCVFDNVMAPTWESIVEHIGMKHSDYHHQDFVIPCLKAEDVERAFKEGKCALLCAIENASAIDRNVDRIDILHGLGLRSTGICYSWSNTLGGGLNETKDGGLTDFGYDAVVRMNKVGILIDVSHAGDVTSMDTIEASKDPICISHRGSRALTNWPRMAPDEVLQACAEKDGVVGIEVAGLGIRTKKHLEPSIEGFLEQMEYCIDLLGIDHVGAGPDTLYTDHAEWYRISDRTSAIAGYGHYQRPLPDGPQKQFAEQYEVLMDGLDHIKGLESPSDFPNIIRGLVRDGYSDDEIAKVAGGNGLRLLKAVL
jgi:membrane dipeptidase